MHNELIVSLLYIHRNHHMVNECHRKIYFEGRARLGQFPIPVLRGNLVQTRGEHDKCMYVPRSWTAIGAKAISVRVPKFWNSIKHEHNDD